MKRSKLLLTAAVVTLSLGLGTPRLQAQGRNNPFRAMSRMLDPTTSSAMVLLQRDDVKSEILLSQRQGEQLDEAQKKAQEDMRKSFKDAMPDTSSMQNLSDDEKKEKMQEVRTKMQEVARTGQAAMSNDIDKKAQEVLRPDQIKRLRELDLQWRGPLALSDTKVAEKFGLTAEQKTKVTALVASYRKTQETMIADVMSSLRPKSDDPNTPPARPDPSAIMTKMAEAQEKLDKIRTEMGDKALEVLTDEQKTAWTTAQGKKFTFRKQDA